MAQNNNNEINNIEVIREINKRYIVIKYFDAEVIYDKETKFINATKLCQHISKVTGKNKQFYHWMELKQTQDFIKDILNEKADARIPAAALDNENNNKKVAPGIPGATLEGENVLYYKIVNAEYKIREIKGTYLHLDLIPQLCNWASKEYAFKISYIINYINGIKDYDSAYSKLKDEKLESKIEEIKKLEEEHQKQLKAKDEEIKRMK